MIFGPAYKGITLAAAVAIELARLGHNKPFAHDRKEPRTTARAGCSSAHRCVGGCW